MRLNILPALMILAMAAFVGGCGEGGGNSKPPAPSSTGTPSTPAPPSSAPIVGTGGGKPQIGIIPPGTAAIYWKAVELGAQKALAEGKKGADGKPVVDIVWQNPAKPGTQVEAAKDLLDKNVAAIVVAPENDESLAGIVAVAGRVPVIAIAAGTTVDKVRSVIGADPAKASEIADQKALGAKDKVKIAPLGVTSDDIAKLQSGQLSALLIADPAEAGAAAIKTASDCMKEKKVDKRINILWRVITKDTLTAPENAPLLPTSIEQK